MQVQQLNNSKSVNLSVPLKIKGKKDYPLNLNWYRNAHYFALNDSKIAFKELVEPFLRQIRPFTKVTIKYTVYAPNKRKFDISNVCSIVDKYFSDALVELGKLEDDSYEFLSMVQYQFGGIDKENPRVDILIEESP